MSEEILSDFFAFSCGSARFWGSTFIIGQLCCFIDHILVFIDSLLRFIHHEFEFIDDEPYIAFYFGGNIAAL